MNATRLFATVLCALAASQARPAETIRIKGSDTIGGKLMPDIAESYHRLEPRSTMAIEALGSATAFVGLFDGSADLGEASRPINEGERLRAKALNIRLREVVIGYDGVAVIVNPDNPIRSLTIDQLSDVFTGKLTNWRQVGGPARPILVISRPSYSGTNAFFKEKVLRRGNPKGPEEYASTASIIEENGAILDAVTSSPGAISYVGLGWLRPSVKAVPISPRQGEPAVRPALETVRTGAYPLYRPLLMYVPTTARPETLRFVRYVLSSAGQLSVLSNGFIPLDEGTPLPAFLASVELPRVESTTAALVPVAPAAALAAPAQAKTDANLATSPRRREITRIVFRTGSASLDPDALVALARVASTLKDGGHKALITGHADSSGSREANQRVARARATVVRDSLHAMGVSLDLMTVDSAGADSPTASNDTPAGRALNRRVDIELVHD